MGCTHYLALLLAAGVVGRHVTGTKDLAAGASVGFDRFGTELFPCSNRIDGNWCRANWTNAIFHKRCSLHQLRSIAQRREISAR